MNHIFKTKWCPTYQSYVVCSELAKRAGKVSGIMATTLLLSNVATATLPKTVSADENLTGTTYTETLNGSFFNINNNATATFNGNMVFDIIANGDNEPHFDITNGNLTTEDKLSITITPDANTKHTRPKGMIIRGDSTVNIKDLAVKVTHASEEDTDYGSPDSNASYGIALGYHHNGGDKDKFSRLTVNNADINITNTENTVFGNKTASSGSIKAKVKFGHQLSGLKIYRTSGSTPEFVSNGTLNINVNDSSAAKAGDYLVGVYISGDGSKATFNGDTNITVSANGINSAGIKIGKPFEDSENGVSVTANGKLIVDTTATADSAAVRLFNNNAKLEVTGKNTQEKSEIKSGNSAIVYDTQDWKTSAHVTAFITLTIYTSRNFNGNNQSVKLNNTELSTTSETASLIKVNAENVRDQSFGRASKFSHQLNHGKFSVKNATFELSGDKSRATAADNGWLMEVKGLDNKKPNDENKSDLTATISDGAKIIGLVHKEHSSKLDLTLNNATWSLKKKGTQTTSTLNNLTLKNNAVLDATLPIIAQADLEQAFNSAKQNFEKELAKVESLKNESNGSEEEFNALKELLLEEPKKKFEEAKKNLEQGEKAEYTIKLSSDGKAIDGTLTNNGGVITLANQKYNDHLTIQGNYVAKGEAKLKVNTLWNSPTAEDELNSQSDLLEITGTATGSTQIISVSQNGNENIIDGSIGSIASDLDKNSAVVVRVHTIAGSDEKPFIGEAKTKGAGLVQLANRVVEDPNNAGSQMKEFFWTLTALNQPDSPILDPVVSGYVQMPQINLAQGYTTLRTLHTRRGENQTLAWDNDQLVKKQSWGRFFGSHLYAKGKTRLGFEMDTLGAQVGYDFDIKTNDQNAHYLTGIYAALTQSKARFSDELRSENGIVQEDKFTGSGKARTWSFGLTHTRYAQNGSYVDLVGQLSFFNNKYHSRTDVKAKNKGLGYLLSAEVGRPYILKASEQHQAHWLIEPQAQLVYQYLDSKKFNDSLKQVTPKGLHHLRGRAGFRLAYNQPADKNNLHTKSLYLTANILHDFTSGNKVQIGQDTIREKYDQTWWDIGLGIQHPIAKKAYVYLDAHYEGNFKGQRTREGYRGSVGIKYNW